MRRSRPRGILRRLARLLAASDDIALTATAKRLLPWLVAVGFFMESLDTTILNTAVPAIAQALDVPLLSMKAVLASYTLSLAVFIPISGWMANRFGTRQRVRIGHRHLHARLVSLRRIQQHPLAGGLPHPARLRRRHDDPGGPHHHGARLCQIRAHQCHELRRHPRTRRPHARAGPGRRDHRLLSLERDFFRQHSDRPVRVVPGLSASCPTIASSATTRWISSDWCCSARELHCCPTCWRCSARPP